MSEYRLSPLALRDLEDIWAYTLDNWSIEQAESYHARLVQAFEDLAAGRKVGRPVNVRTGYRKLAVGSHVVFYRTSGSFVDVMRVLHQRMDVSRHL